VLTRGRISLNISSPEGAAENFAPLGACCRGRFFFPGVETPGYIPEPFSRAIVVGKTYLIRETKYSYPHEKLTYQNQGY
jgi:hypothetical protein